MIYKPEVGIGRTLVAANHAVEVVRNGNSQYLAMSPTLVGERGKAMGTAAGPAARWANRET